MPLPRLVSRALTTPAGVVLAAGLAGVGWLLHQRPLHPWGVTVQGVLRGDDDALPLGPTDVVVRLSVGAGMPRGWPEVFGIAVRWYDAGGRPQDLLLSSAGPGLVTRFVPLPRRRVLGWFTTVMPLRTTSGPVLLAVRPSGASGISPGTVVLDVLRATPRGPWLRAGELHLLGPETSAGERGASSRHLRFDPTRNAPHGLGTYGWEDGLRSLAYAAARQAARDAP